MTNNLSNPLGKGICNHNSITFSCGVGVQSPVTAQLNWSQVIEFAENPQCVEKQNARWILPHSIASRKKMDAELGNFGLIWADVDEPPSGGLDEVVGAIKKAPFLAYTTKSATETCQRSRVLVPLANPIELENWTYNQTILNKTLKKVGIEPDECNLNPAQILFLPNRGSYYAYRHREGLFNAKPSQEGNPTPNHLPSMASINPIQPTPPKTARGGVIDRFNLAYRVEDILRLANYKQNPSNPLSWRHPRSESGSYSATINPNTGRVHSLSSRDPLYTGGGGGGAHDSFGAFTVLFCENNLRKAVWKAANEMLEGAA